MKWWCVFKKELLVYFGSFLAYALTAAFLVLSGYFFYTDLIFSDLFGTFTSTTSTLWQFYFLDLRFVTLLIIPLLTMRLFAEEKKLGTIELLGTYPLRDSSIILGKFLSCFFIFEDQVFSITRLFEIDCRPNVLGIIGCEPIQGNGGISYG